MNGKGLARTWSGSVIQLHRGNFFRWLKGWALWTLELRPRVSMHNHQAHHSDFPPPVKPWRDSRTNAGGR